MAIGDGDTWDESNPTDATLALQIDDYMRDVRKGTRLRLANEHEFPASGGVSAAGQHKYITLQAQAVKPTLSGTQVGAVYVDTNNSLIFENSAGATLSLVSVPSGGIIMYSGSVSAANALAPIWYVCNGSNSTPNLQDRFIICAGSTYAAGSTGGASTVTLTTNEMPSHDHAVRTMDGSGGNTAIQRISAANGTEQNIASQAVGTGNGAAFSVMNPYYALAFIMRA